MNPRLGPHAPAHYEIRFVGHLDEHWSTWFDGLAVIHEDDGTTTLRGAVPDQAGLHGLLAKVRDLGATLISVMPAGAGHGEGPPAPLHMNAPTTCRESRPELAGLAGAPGTPDRCGRGCSGGTGSP